jgi:hypothetical protein
MLAVAFDRENDSVSGRRPGGRVRGRGGPDCLDHLAGPQPGPVSGCPFRAMLRLGLRSAVPAKTSQEFGMSSGGFRLRGVFPVAPGGGLVVAGAGLEAAVQDAD